MANIFNSSNCLFHYSRRYCKLLISLLYASLEEFYLNVEKTIKKNILFKKKIYRPFKDNRDYNDWNLRLENDKFKKYLSKIDSSGILTCKSGYLDVSKYLS